jgi:O-antigen ligase
LIVRRQDLIVNPIMPLMFLFLIVQVIGAIFSVDTRVSFNHVINYMVEGLGLYLLITNVARTQEMLRRAIWVLLLAGAFMGSLSVYQQMTHTFDNNYGGFAQMSNAAFGTGTENLFGENTQPRLAGPIGEQNRYAQNMLMLVPLGLFRFWGERSKRLRILAAIATALITLGAALTFSRGAAVGLILMLVITALMGYIKPFQAVIIGLGLVLLLQVVPQYGTRLDTLGDVSSAVTTQGGGGLRTTDGATQSRITEMMAAAMVFADYPIVGVGPGTYRYYYQDYADRVGLRTLSGDRQAHDLYVGIAAENGALGLIAFGAIVFVTLRSLAKTRKRWGQSRPDMANLVTGFILSIVAYLATGVFLHFAFIRFFWLIMALAGAASYIAANSAEAADDRKGVAAL